MRVFLEKSPISTLQRETHFVVDIEGKPFRVVPGNLNSPTETEFTVLSFKGQHCLGWFRWRVTGEISESILQPGVREVLDNWILSRATPGSDASILHGVIPD